MSDSDSDSLGFLAALADRGSFLRNGNAEPNPDPMDAFYAKVDCDLGCEDAAPHVDASEVNMSDLKEAMCWLLRWCWETKDTRRVRAAMHRFVTASVLLRADLVGSGTLSDLARELGISRGLLSHYAVQFSDACNLKFRVNRQRRHWDMRDSTGTRMIDGRGKPPP